MNEIAIQVQDLSKQYKIRFAAGRHNTLRDEIAYGFKSLFGRNGRPSTLGDPSALSNCFWAIKDVSFEVKKGEVLGIIGRNGAGKSTLLKVLSRLTVPTKGQAEIHGRVGSLLEVGTGFHGELTGRENLYLNGAILGMKKAEIDGKFDEIVAFAEVEKFIDTPVKRYSSGMHVRLAFAVAAHMETEILLVDEVLAVGDAEFQKKCLGKMGDVARRGRTVLFVSHDMSAIQLLCSETIRLASGKIVGSGPTKEQVEAYLKVAKSIGFIKTQEGLQLGPNTRLKSFEVSPNPIVSGAPLQLSMELESSLAMRINELAVIIHDALGRRIAILDLRPATGYHRT